jgi:rRNA maturation protein Nop10
MTHLLSQCDPIAGCGKTYPADLHNCTHCGADAAFSKPAPLNPRDWGYDIETYPNIFSAVFIHALTGLTKIFEISDRKNDWFELVEFMRQLGLSGGRGVGFNNIHFDYPILHHIALNPNCGVDSIYNKAMSTIKNSQTIWGNEYIFSQLDLFKIHHFDNRAKSTSLKALEIVMRSHNVVDLPYPVGTYLNDDEKDILIKYNIHDVKETLKFYVRSLAAIELREKLSETYNIDMTNFSNTKIGGTILISQMEKSGIQCYTRDFNNKRVPRQTIRTSINLGDVIFPYVKFERHEFNHIVEFFKNKTLTRDEISEQLKTKGVFNELSTIVEGFQYDYGVGGIHGSVNSQIVSSNETHQIVDVDVTSFYPRMAIINKMYPEHLGEAYCDIYNNIFEQRKTYKKGTPENAALKEALNASYGNSNNLFSPLLDPKYTMMTTINGQLLLCMLAEQLIKIPNLMMIQANTDGLTFSCPRIYIDHMREVCKWWENVTQLELEEALYSRMIIRDVNNYIAEYENGKLKRKGAYEYNTLWHQDPSSQIVARAAEAALVRGEDIRIYITNHKNPFDFMIRAKVPRDSKVVMRWKESDVEQELQNTTRFFVSHNGGSLLKISPPKGAAGTWKRKNGITDEFYNSVMNEIKGLGSEVDTAGIPHDTRIHTGNRSTHTMRESSLCAGWTVTECANANDFNWSELNYDYYIKECEKIVLPLLTISSD